MRNRDTVLLALNALQYRQLRSWLAILGIVIGVGSILSLISISLGLQAQISARMNSLGANVITISPGGQAASRFGIGAMQAPSSQQRIIGGSSQITFREADDLRTLPGVSVLDARVSGRVRATYKDKNMSLNLVGSEPSAFKDTVGVDILYGRALSAGDQYSVVLGYSVANNTFNDIDMVNKQIKLEGVQFRVVGILNASGSSFSSSDSSIYIPQKTARDLLNRTVVSQITVIAAADHDTDAVAASIEEELIALHHVTKDTEDFTVQTATTVESTVSSVTDILTLFLAGIASISLIVGGIGVANTMFMSVLEQTKYIGILKSLGAKNKDVLMLFLSEAGIIGLVGGIFGILLSVAVSFILSNVGLPSLLTFELVGGGLGFSIIVGLVSGLVPARNAAALQPIEALRYE